MYSTIASFVLYAIVGVACTSGDDPPAARPQHQFYVSPGGSDADPGTESKPFATIQRAQQAVRQVNQQMTGDVVVVLRGGTYRLAQTLVFDHRDSGTRGHAVVYGSYPGETPILSGGRPIKSWQPDAGGRWKARTSVENFRQLYVDGRRATRARGGPPAAIQLFGKDGFKTSDVAMAGWRNPSDVELCFYVMWGPLKAWTHTRCKVESLRREGSETVIRMLQPHFTIARTKQGVQINLPAYVENAFELLDEPGEWYLDRPAGMVYYVPQPGQDMRRAEVIAPAVDTLVALRGTLDQPVQHVRFEGITFAEAGWLRPSQVGLVDVQANFVNDLAKLPTSIKPYVTTIHDEFIKAPANVVCHAAHSIHFERCTFTRLGGAGLDLEFGAQENVVSGCRFCDISGTAIQVGDVLKNDHHPDDPRMVVRGNAVRNNVIHEVGVDYQGSVGIFAGYVAETTIAHNEIHHLPYSGISVGWGWGELDAGGGAYHQPFVYQTPTPAKNNLIERNHVHHVMQVLNDGGGIYTLGNMPGTVIRGNHIHDNPGIPGGIYLDEGSGLIEVAGNLVHSVPRPMNFNNRSQNRIATCNVHGNFFSIRPGGPHLASGKLGKAMVCDGVGELVEVPHTSRLDPPRLTVEAWIRLADYPSGKDGRRWIVNKNAHEQAPSHYALVIDGKKAGAYLNVGGPQGCHAAWSPELLALNTWHHLAMSYDGAVLRLYCDGRAVASQAVNKPRVSGNTPLVIGCRQDGSPSSYFKGLIDEVRIYDRALTPEEVRTNSQASAGETGKERAGPVKEGLVGYWSFDELWPVPSDIQRIAAEAGLEVPYRNLLQQR